MMIIFIRKKFHPRTLQQSYSLFDVWYYVCLKLKISEIIVYALNKKRPAWPGEILWEDRTAHYSPIAYL